MHCKVILLVVAQLLLGCTATGSQREADRAGCLCHARKCESVTAASGQAAIEGQRRNIEMKQ
jgi:hypothetical protein